LTSRLRLAVVAAEPSGDRLGAGVLAALRDQYGDLELRGIGGPEMARLGLDSRCDIHDLSVMGVEDLFRKLPRALNVRRKLLADLLRDPPDLFLGIDSPDFNLTLERKLRNAGIPTAHLVSPTVWAWRGYRLRKIRKSVDHMLVLFPFEEVFYRERGIPATCVGHPAARETAALDRATVREKFGLESDEVVIAVLPGSRESEINRLGSIFAQAIDQIASRHSRARFLVPLANPRVQSLFEGILARSPIGGAITLLNGQAREVLAASDVALLASGTAALEAALVGTPMVVAYRVSWLSYWLARLLAKTDKVSMPNHLLPTPLIPEFLQTQASPPALANAISALLEDKQRLEETSEALLGIRDALNLDTNALIAQRVTELRRIPQGL